MIVKKCSECHEFFESKLDSFINICPKHFNKKWKRYLLSSIKHARYISLDRFDVWDTDYPIIRKDKIVEGLYERVCRICGNRLTKKNGSHSYHKRYCHNPCGANDIWMKYSWSAVRDYFFSKNRNNQCAKCNNEPIAEIHHIVPVHTLTWENLYLLWDESNLIALGLNCHHKQDHQLKKTKKELAIIRNKGFRKIGSFYK